MYKVYFRDPVTIPGGDGDVASWAAKTQHPAIVFSNIDQSQTSIQVTWSVLTNYRPVQSLHQQQQQSVLMGSEPNSSVTILK